MHDFNTVLHMVHTFGIMSESYYLTCIVRHIEMFEMQIYNDVQHLYMLTMFDICIMFDMLWIGQMFNIFSRDHLKSHGRRICMKEIQHGLAGDIS